MAARLSISLTFDTCHTNNVYLKYSFYNHNVHVLFNEFERYFGGMMVQDIDPNARSKNFEKKAQRKLKRLQHLISNDAGVVCSNDPTKHLVVCNAGLCTGLDSPALINEFTKFGAIHDFYLPRNKSYCFITCASVSDAVNIYNNTNSKCRLGQNETVIYLIYCESVPAADSKDPLLQPLPPGLIILKDFINEEEEDIFINLIEWHDEYSDTDSALKNRQVKHFGYEFCYDNNNVDASNPLKEPIPTECTLIWKRLASEYPNMGIIKDAQQLTVNKYNVGQGIPSHVDTHSAFTDKIVSLSLANDIVMEFRKPKTNNCNVYISHVSVSLPRRSLLILSGESRYGWKHAIVPRRIDVVRNEDNYLTSRQRSMRISYTFRWLSGEDCNCKYTSICDTAQKLKTTETKKPTLIQNPSECELENVHKVYNEIANHFSETRHSQWPQVLEFITSLSMGSILVDIGCGNGKYLQLSSDTFGIGCDRSEGLLNVCYDRKFNVFQCDCLAVPIKSNSVDGCISIAVIHHLASEERRKQAMSEMIRILRPQGKALIYVWAKNQEVQNESNYLKQKYRKNRKDQDPKKEFDVTSFENLPLPVHTNRTQFEHTDLLVPWKLKASKSKSNNENDSKDDNPKTFLRYYHVFEEQELEKMCSQFENILIVKSYYDQGNWCVIIQKK